MYAVVSVKVYPHAKNMQYFLCPERTVCLKPKVALRQVRTLLPSSSHLVHTSKPEAKYSNTERTQNQYTVQAN